MAIRHWVGDDAGYENWLATHPTGFQGNMGNPPTGAYFRIHRATCTLPDRSLPGSVNPRTGNKYTKVTADTVAELEGWAVAHMPQLDILGPNNYCKVCVPMGGVPEPGARLQRATRVVPVNQTALFASLGAPLVNSRWSWGAVRPADGAVFLRVWQDRMRTHDGQQFVQITHHARYGDNSSNPGYRERVRHVDRVREGSACYLVMCEAVDPFARPRKVRRFNDAEVFPGGHLTQMDGEWWVEILPGVPIGVEARVDRPDDDSAEEGRALLRLHRTHERSRGLVSRKKRLVLAASGRLVCEACDFDFAAVYGTRGDGFAECHHILPIAQSAPGRRTRLSELAVVCANCHRMLHRRPWVSVPELRAQLTSRLGR